MHATNSFHICPTTSYFSSAIVWNKNEIKTYFNVVLLLPNICCQTWKLLYCKGPTFPFWEHRFQTFCEERDGHKLVNLRLDHLNRTIKNIFMAFSWNFFELIINKQRLVWPPEKLRFDWIWIAIETKQHTFWILWSVCIFNSTNLEEISEEIWMHIFNPWNSYERLKTCSHFGNVGL